MFGKSERFLYSAYKEVKILLRESLSRSLINVLALERAVLQHS